MFLRWCCYIHTREDMCQRWYLDIALLVLQYSHTRAHESLAVDISLLVPLSRTRGHASTAVLPFRFTRARTMLSTSSSRSQATIVASVALTLAYTPLLKPIPLVKNFVVAMVIAAAIAAGGLAAGAGVASTLTPSVLTFFVIGEGGYTRP